MLCTPGGGDRRALDLDLPEQPLNPLRIEQSGAEVDRRLGAAGDAVGQRVLDAAATTPWSLISRIRRPISSSLIGSA